MVKEELNFKSVCTKILRSCVVVMEKPYCKLEEDQRYLQIPALSWESLITVEWCPESSVLP